MATIDGISSASRASTWDEGSARTSGPAMSLSTSLSYNISLAIRGVSSATWLKTTVYVPEPACQSLDKHSRPYFWKHPLVPWSINNRVECNRFNRPPSVIHPTLCMYKINESFWLDRGRERSMCEHNACAPVVMSDPLVHDIAHHWKAYSGSPNSVSPT